MDLEKLEKKNLDGNPVFTGAVKKKCNYGIWKARIFVLTDNGILYTFKKKSDKTPTKKRGQIIKEMYFTRKGVTNSSRKHVIQIERYPHPLLFSVVDGSTLLEWFEALAKVGGIRRDSEKGKKKKYTLGDMKIKYWKTDDVVEFLDWSSTGNENMKELYGKLFIEKGVNGKSMQNLTKDDLEKMGVSVFRHRMMIMRAIMDLKKKGCFDLDKYVVLRKIKEMYNSRFDDMMFLSRALSDPGSMRDTYLNPSMLEESFLKNLADEELEKQIEKDDDEEEEEGENSITTENDKPVDINLSLSKNRDKFTLPVKLVVTEMTYSKRNKTVRKIFSPIFSKIPSFSTEFGMFHTAIIVGPWYLEWTDSSLVIPRKLYSGLALITADMSNETMLKNQTLDEITEKLSTVVCKWNTSMKYSKLPGIRGKTGNCQEFVEDVMETLSLFLKKEGVFGDFLKEMKVKGRCEMVLKLSKKFKSHFDLKINSIKFETHEEIDNFVTNLNEIDGIALTLDFKDEYTLLRSFDRSFWLRHIKNPREKKFQQSKKKCPFNDPRTTGSFCLEGISWSSCNRYCLKRAI